MSRHLVWGELTCSERSFFNFSRYAFKSIFLENNHIRARKKAKWNKEYIKVLERKSVPTHPYTIHVSYHWNIYVLFIRMQQNEKLNDYLTPYISELALALNLQQIVGRIANWDDKFWARKNIIQPDNIT